MTSTEVRKQFLQFFAARAHRIVPSAPVIPHDDPTLLFTNAGMNQFKDVFLGTGKRDYLRAADSQKCIRVSGKHNDLEEVGRDTYHHTFFEMLGNWSFGDYYKKEAIEWAWELLTKEWGLEKKRLYATVYESDDEAEQLWKSVTDIDPSHVVRFGKKDNFWEMGETGPCGPCSEIHIDLTPDYSGGHLVNAGDARVMEIWNLVFIQYDKVITRYERRPTFDGQSFIDVPVEWAYNPLPSKHVDTGMGFERICAVLQGKKSNYDTDVFMPIIARISELAGMKYTATLDGATDIAMRVIADHVRMLSFSIADGGIPSNEGRGYVMRRILRRAARFGRNLDMHEPFIYKVVEAVVAAMGTQYSEIKEKQSHIERVIKGEEESFNATLDRGLEIFELVVKKLGSSKLFPGEDAFKLYDTFGFPLDLTELMAAERGLTVDTRRFTQLMEEQKERSRAVKFYGEISDQQVSISSTIHTKFVGYEQDEFETEVIECQPSYLGTENVFNHLVIAETPFYTEAGGQVGDIGQIIALDIEEILDVPEVFKAKSGTVIHTISGDYNLQIGSRVKARIATSRRRNIERNHTATHLMHEALRRVIGTNSHQQGSLVDPDRLRFDFNHFEKITPDQVREIEDIVNGKIAENILVEPESDPAKWISIEEAKKKYPRVKMFFGDKYGDKVRVVIIDPDFSVELCGGTHVKNTKDIGLFKIISEVSIASGVRRIEAVTGEGLNQYINERYNKIGEFDEQLSKLVEESAELEKQLGHYAKVEVSARPSLGSVTLPGHASKQALDAVEQALHLREQEIESLTKQAHDLKKELSKHRVKGASSSIDDLVANCVALNGFKLVSAKIKVDNADELKSLGDTLRSKLYSGVGVLGAVVDEKVALVCVVTDDLIKDKKLQAGKIVGELAKRLGGGGGGKPHLATAGGKDVAKLDETLQEAVSIVQSMLTASS